MLTTHTLHRPIYGAAHLDPDTAVLTVGTHADGTPARWRLASRGRAQHTTVLGDHGAGTSSLLRSILHAATIAGVEAHSVDLSGTVAAARLVLAEQHDLARALVGEPDGDQGLRLLVLDDLDELTKDRSFVDRLTRLTKLAGRAGIAVVAGTGDVSLSGFGGRFLDATLTRQALTQQLVLLRTGDGPMLRAGLRALGVDLAGHPPIPARSGDGSTTAGIGYLPRRSTVPFRAWLP